jgi:DNA repair protein NreA
MGDEIKFEAVKKIASTGFKIKDFSHISRVDSISPPSVFIGSKLKYPLVNVGILSPLDKDDNSWLYDDAKYWADNNLNIEEVMALRNGLLNSRFQAKVSDIRLNKKFVEVAKDVAISSKQIDVEIELKNRLIIGREKDKVLTPHGMRAGLKNVEITGNLKVDKHVDKAMNDDIKASESMEFLYKNNINEYTLSKILSVGALGLAKNKKLVPTRWSITATDDTLGKQFLKNVRNYPWIENYELFYGEFMGNQYLVLMFPSVWSYELFELYLPGSSWNPGQEIKASTDMEGYDGRKEYAFDTAGGYYASRFAILEYLNSVKKQASVIALRIETPSYWAALGVWVVRESVKKAMKHRMKFATREELLESVKKIGKIKYDFDFSDILDRSKLLKEKKEQKSLFDFVKSDKKD